jgi:hypothetical protein
MPVMPRSSKKGQKIAFAILGVPSNLKSKKTKYQKFIDKRLKFEDTMMVK